MFELMLMRHAKSDWQNNCADIDRPLNQRGEQDALRMGAYLQQLNLVPDKMIVSTARRTEQTAERLLQHLSLDPQQCVPDDQLYLADTEALCEIISLYAKDKQRLLVLAHNPGMDYLVSHLAGRQATYTDTGKLMTTCAVACFSLDSLEDLKKSGKARLIQLIRAKEIVAVT